jgi:hypothetical protein
LGVTLVAPSIEPPIQIDFGIVEKALKLPHLPPIKPIIALVFCFIDHVEIACSLALDHEALQGTRVFLYHLPDHKHK